MVIAGGVGEVAIITAFINRATAFASGLCKDYYKGSKELEDFPERITALRVKHHFWKTQLKRYGMTADQLVAPLVVSATNRLEQEERRLRKINESRCCLKSWRRINYLVFPGQLTASVQAVIDGFDNIPLMLKGSKENITQLESTKSDKVLKLPFEVDGRYVPLESTFRQIKEALEDPVSQRVSRLVLLYGGPGSGKSNLASYVALHYQKGMLLHHERNRELLQQSSLFRRQRSEHSRHVSLATDIALATEKDSPVGSPKVRKPSTAIHSSLDQYPETAATNVIAQDYYEGNSTTFGDGVFYLHCGEGADLIAKQLELLQGLGFTPKGDAGKELTPTKANEKVIRKHLLVHLEEQDVLIVLDDVWDSNLIQGLITPGKRVRYLVTSQNARLWEDAVAIEIEQVSLELGRQIMAAHIGMVGDEIPPPLQEVADEIIKATDANPLALANLAMALNLGRVNTVEEWMDVRDNYFSLLDSEEIRPVAFGQRYPRSIACSMMLAVESLPETAQKLLYAAAVFDGPSIPLVVVELLFKCSHGDKHVRTLMRWRNYLEDRDLILLERHTVPWSKSVHVTLAIHGLRQQFVLVKKESEVNSIVNSLLEDPPASAPTGVKESEYASDKFLATILCALYGQNKYANRAIEKLHSVYLEQLHKLNCIGRVRAWATPIVSLLNVTSRAGKGIVAKQRLHRSARQVFYELVCNWSVENGISNLLALPEAVLPTCWALTLDRIWTSHLHRSHIEGVLQGLLSLFQKGPEIQGVAAEVQEVAAKALANISGCLHRTTEVAYPGNLENLVHLLWRDFSDSVKEDVVRAVGNLVASQQTKIENCPQVLQALVELIGSRVSPNVQKEAVRALGLLAGDGENRVAIAKFPGLLDQLSGLLRRNVSPVVRNEVKQSMKRLSDSGEAKPGTPGAIVARDCLETLLLDVNPALQKMAKRVLLLEDAAVGDEPPTSVETFINSCYDKIKQRLYEEALVDLQNADRLLLAVDNTNTTDDQIGISGLRQLRFKKTTLTSLNVLTLSQLKVFVKAMLKDHHGALSDVEKAIALLPSRSFNWQERGVLKRIMGDLNGALADLNTRLERNPLSYESLKHRAYVKFLLGDISGASADAEMALKVGSNSQSRNESQSSKTSPPVVDCLGMLPVQFLDYNLI